MRISDWSSDVCSSDLITPWLLVAGCLMILATMFVWWRDVIKEAVHQGHHTKVVQLGLRYGMILFIASEVMFFSAFFWAFFDASLFPGDAMQEIGRAHV